MRLRPVRQTLPDEIQFENPLVDSFRSQTVQVSRRHFYSIHNPIFYSYPSIFSFLMDENAVGLESITRF
jgi:hypothetical protein